MHPTSAWAKVSWRLILLAGLCWCISAQNSVDPVVRYSTTGTKILACYYTRSKRLPASNVPANLCTHIIYAFGVMSPSGIVPNSVLDVQDYNTLVALKKTNSSLKVMISVQQSFSSVVAQDSAGMTRFSSLAVKFLQKYEFDGLDLDWEYPTSSEKTPFSKFIQILSQTLHSSKMLLSMALPNSPLRFKNGFDAATINKCVDFMTVMAYDFHMYLKDKDNTTGYHSALVSPKGESSYYSVQGLINFYLNQSLTASKLLLGIPTYGRSWTLADAQHEDLHSPAVGKGGPAPYSGLTGLYIYPDVCTAIKEGAKTVRDHTSVAQYLVREGKTWVAYENSYTVETKVQWAGMKNLAGVGVWSLQSDDAQNICNYGTFPLVNFIRTTL